jgi:hypothetical protein
MEAVEDAILAFPGAAIIVTHDRYLLGRVADSLLRIHDRKCEFRDGGYEDNQAWVDLDLGSEEEAGDGVKEPAGKSGVRSPESGAKQPPQPAPRPVDKEKQKAQKRFEKKVAEAEARVGALETKLAALGAALAAMDPADWPAFSAKLDEQKALETELAYAMGEWEEAQAALESAGA